MRTVCKAFACNYSILRRLFSHVNLVADLTWINAHSRDDIRPFVHHIKAFTFLPPKIRRWAWKYRLGVCRSDRWPGGIPRWHNRREALDASKDYSQSAARNRLLLETNEFVVLAEWCNFLEMLLNSQYTITFGFIDHGQLDTQLRQEYLIRMATGAGVSAVARHTSGGAIADAVFGVALDALAKESVSIEQLHLKIPMLATGRWAEILRRMSLNCGKLAHIEMNIGMWTGPGPFSQSATNQTMLADATYPSRQSESTLKALYICGVGLMMWPRDLRLPSLNLRFISLANCDTSCTSIASMITPSTRIEVVTLCNVSLHDDVGINRWKTVFDAFREHPRSGIKVRIDGVFNGDQELFADLYVTHEVVPDFQLTDEIQMHWIRALQLYMDGQIDWIEILEWTWEDEPNL